MQVKLQKLLLRTECIFPVSQKLSKIQATFKVRNLSTPLKEQNILLKAAF